MAEEKNNIDSAIDSINSYIDSNQLSTRRLITYLMFFSVSILLVIVLLYLFPLDLAQKKITPELFKVPENVLYAIFAIFVIVFGVLMAIYRFHLNEIARSEHYKMGFMRIRVAANNFESEGFAGEVRTSLTKDAFSYNQSPAVSASRDKKIESPLPGSPTSDITAIVLNKLLENFELKKK